MIFVFGKMSEVMDAQNCFHCGLDIIKEEEIFFDEPQMVLGY